MRLNNVALDGATERLIAAARATQFADALPVASGKALVAHARGVRLYLEARQPKLAAGQLDAIDKLMATAEDKDLRTAYTRLVGDVRRIITREVVSAADWRDIRQRLVSSNLEREVR